MKALSEDSFLARLLAKLAAAVIRHPRWFFWPQIALFVACIFYTVAFLKFDMNQNDLVGPNQKYHENFLRLQKEFPQPDDLAVVVESDDIEKNRQFVERVGARLQGETNYFQDVFFAQSPLIMGSNALLYASEPDLVQLKAMLHAAQPFIEKFTRTTNLVSFFDQINTAIRTAPQDTNADALINSLPALTH